jgi:hypothetical protein
MLDRRAIGAARWGNAAVRTRWHQLLSSLEAGFAWLGDSFVDRWGRMERGYRRPFARIA